MPHVTWMKGLKKTLPRAVRLSWETHVFLPGEQVMLDRGFAALPDDAAQQILANSDAVCADRLTVRETFIDAGEASGKSRWPELHAYYSFVGCAGVWPHPWFIDPRPMRHLYGAIVNVEPGHAEPGNGGNAEPGSAAHGDISIMPLLAGSTHQRDPAQSLITLEPALGRRAKAALKVAEVTQLAPMLGEFLIALTSETTGILYAALWHSPLDAVDETMLRPMLEAAHPAHRTALPRTGQAQTGQNV